MSDYQTTALKPDVYERVTSQIANAIEAGVGNWRMPRHTSRRFAFSPINVLSKKPYRAQHSAAWLQVLLADKRAIFTAASKAQQGLFHGCAVTTPHGGGSRGMRTQINRPAGSALVPYCGRLHRIIDGLPVAHRCRILPVDSITAAINGDFERAVSLMAQAAAQGPLPSHPGIWRLRRR